MVIDNFVQGQMSTLWLEHDGVLRRRPDMVQFCGAVVEYSFKVEPSTSRIKLPEVKRGRPRTSSHTNNG